MPQIKYHYYMKELLEYYDHKGLSTTKKSDNKRNIYLKHLHENWSWFNQLNKLLPSVPHHASDLSNRMFDPNELGNPKIRVKNLVAEEIPNRKYMLLFDLDETLIHCDIKTQPKNAVANGLSVGEAKNKTNVNIRPFARELLETMSKVFELGVYTASADSYANEVVRNLDKMGKYIRFVLSRKDCVEVKEGIFVKDLRIIKNRKMEHIFLVDNYAHSYIYQPDNGIPIIPYYEGTTDDELLKLRDYLKELARQDDPLNFNIRYFQSRRFMNEPDVESLDLEMTNHFVKLGLLNVRNIN